MIKNQGDELLRQIMSAVKKRASNLTRAAFQPVVGQCIFDTIHSKPFGSVNKFVWRLALSQIQKASLRYLMTA